ncbi:MAG: hypothetical protein M0P39_02740 [Rhodocyclaceae bacterium]|nr:hypothetical protein [Rhodocyclaceae bacterium]
MNTGRVIADEFGSFEDEVLNAGWLPPPAGAIETAAPAGRARSTAENCELDTEAFLRQIYASQE